MPVGNWNLEFLNHNSQRNYPLADDASCVDDSGSFTIPTDFILELDLPLHAGLDVDTSRFFIKHLGVYQLGYSVVIGYQPDGEDPIDVAVALISKPNHTPNTVYSVGGTGDFADTVGKIVIGRLDDIDKEPAGFWTFSLEHTRIDPDALRPIIRGVSSITCVNGSQRSQPLYGHIELRGGANMQISPIIVAGENPVIVFSAIDGEGTVEECVCAGDVRPTEPITSINGVRPKPNGDFPLIAGTCLRIDPIENGLKIANTCASPCCGPTELERITRDLERFGAQAASVQQFADRVGDAVSTMELTVLGSKLGATCATC